jgi:hypothetical protein
MELYELLGRVVAELRSGNDRACAVVAGSLLAFQLERLLTAHLRHLPESRALFQTYQPLSTFSSRIAASYALGLIPENIFHDLTRIRKIRNEFSHEFNTTTFDSDPARSHIHNLFATNWFLERMHLADKPIPASDLEDIRARPRRRFEIAVAIVSIALDTFIVKAVRSGDPPEFLPYVSIQKPIA